MAAGDDDRSDRPDYKVYRAGRGRKDRGGTTKRPARKERSAATDRARKGSAKDDEGPDYNVYRSSRNPLRKLAAADLGALRERLGERRKARRRREVERPKEPAETPLWRRVLKFALIGGALWFLLSVVLFGISAQIQKGKLNDAAADELGAFPLMVASPQTILVMGTDVRPPGVPDASGNPTAKKCTEAAGRGDPFPGGCLPTRADTLLLVRAGGGDFEKLSIPRDTLADIPGTAPDKINAAYNGGAARQIEAVERFLGIDIDHAVIVDFDGFEDLIDAVGGVKIRLTDRFKSKVGGGAGQGGITLTLDRGEHTLDGQEALVYARTRTNLRADGAESDLDRARRQQQVLDGLRSRLTSPWRAPINFIRGPLIAWNAPKAMVSDMGGFTLPQLALSAAIGGDSSTTILGNKGTNTGPGGSIVVSPEQCRRAVRKFLGEPPPREPACSPLA